MASFVQDSHGVWQSSVDVPFWEGCGARFGDVQTGREIPVIFAPERGARGDRAPDDAEGTMIEAVLANLAPVSAAFLKAAAAWYDSARDSYGYDPAEAAAYMPPLAAPGDLRPLLRLREITIHQLARDGMAYTGFVCDAWWDREHGLGGLMHGTRAVEIGGQDAAILLWIAAGDGATAI